MPERGWVKSVSVKWVRVIGEHRPPVICLWQAGYSSWSRVQPGDLIVLKLEGSYENIVAFGTVVGRMPAFTSVVWDRYGVSTGSPDRDDLDELVARRMRARRPDPVIGIMLIGDLAFFPERPFKPFERGGVPRGLHFRDALAGDLCEELRLRLYAHLALSGVDEKAATAIISESTTKSVLLQLHAWEDTVRAAYRGFCAVSNVRAKDVLNVVAIKPFENGGPVHVSNGLVLDLIMATLFVNKRIAFHTNGVLLVSPDLALEDAMLYRDLTRRELRPPRRLEDRPDPELMLWRLNNHFHR